MLFATPGSVEPWRWVKHGIFFCQEDVAFTLDELSSEIDVALEKLLEIVGNEQIAVVLTDADEVDHTLSVETLPELQALIEQSRTDVQKCRHCGRRNP
ncbi:MAG: hypothetical protein NTX28_06305 [Novosphingobium sp.]|nr:hypothetical protein [Novosphingobium sp.]